MLFDQKTLTFFIIPDIMEHDLREIVSVDYVSGKSAIQYIEEIIGDIESLNFNIIVNGEKVDYDFVIEPGSSVSVSVDYGAPIIATWVTGAASLAEAVGWGGIFGGLIYGAVYVAATFIITTGLNMILKAIGLLPSQSESSDDTASQTYGWGDVQQTYAEGMPIQLVRGIHETAGHCINQFTTVGSDGKEYYYALMCVNDGVVDEITDIKINGQPYTNYKGVTIHTRLGTLNQAEITDFNEISQQKNPAVELRNGVPFVYESDGDAVEKISLIFTFPAGIGYADDEGNYDSRTVDIKIEYRTKSSGIWLQHEQLSVSAATTEQVRRSSIIDNLDPDSYEVRVTRLTADDSDHRTHTDSFFSFFVETIKQSLSYPGLALYGIKTLATDQLSNSTPTFSCTVKKLTVPVFNPYTNQWVYRDAMNPAWATYDLIVNHHEISPTRIVYDEFVSWANYCDELVDGEYRFRMSIILDTQTNIWDNVQKIAQIGQATIMRRGTYYGVFVDKPVDVASHIFTSANIIEGSFQLKYLPKKDRANAVEITYCDPDRGYTNQIAPVYSSDYNDSSTTDKKTSVQIYAAITRARAFQYAARTLNSNAYLLKTASWKAFTDSFTCIVGDVTYFQHFVPHYDVNWGGRIVSASNEDGQGVVKLNRKITTKAGTNYSILIRLEDDTFVEKIVDSTIQQESDEFTLLSSFITLPKKNDIFMFGETSIYKERYRIVQISTAHDNIRSITGLEYSDLVYFGDDYQIGEDEYTPPVTQQAINVSSRERLIYALDGSYQSVIDVNWAPNSISYAGNWSIYLEDLTDNNAVINKIADTPYTKYVITSEHIINGHEYKIYICPFAAGVYDVDDNVDTITVLGKFALPSDVAIFNADWDAAIRSVVFTWTSIVDIDTAGYEIRRGTTWATAELVVQVYGKDAASHVYLVPIGTVASTTYLIKAFDTSGGYSENATGDSVDVNSNDTELEVPTGLSLTTSSSVDSDGSVVVTLFADWNNNSELVNTFNYYSVKLTQAASGKTTNHVSEISEFQWNVIGNTSYRVQVQAVDRLNNRTLYCDSVTLTSGKDTVPPDAPSDLTVSAGFKTIFLKWTLNPDDVDISHCKIERGKQVFIDSNISAWASSGTPVVTDLGDGVYSINDNDVSNYEYKRKETTIDPSITYRVSVKIPKDAVGRATRFPALEISFRGAVAEISTLMVDSATGEYLITSAYGGASGGVEDAGDYWRVWISAKSFNQSNSTLRVVLFPAIGASSVWAQSISAVGTTSFLNPQIFEISEIGNKSGSFTTDTDLDVSTLYQYRVKSVDTSGNESAWSPAVSGTTTQVGSTDIAYNSIGAAHIYVMNLAAINANMGTITAGVLQSVDWSATAGFELDLNNETMKFGGSTAPVFEWNGSEIAIRNTAEGQELTLSGTEMTIGNTDDGDYMKLTSGDIEFWRYINGGHYQAKSLKRMEFGIATSGQLTTIPGYWKYPPYIHVSHNAGKFYSAAYSNQDQSVNCAATNIEESPAGSGIYKFTPRAELVLSSGTVYIDPVSDLSFYAIDTDQNVNTWQTFTSTEYYTTPNNTTVAQINWNCVYSWHSIYLIVKIYVVINGVEYLIDEQNRVGGGLYNQIIRSGTLQITGLSAAAHNIYIRIKSKHGAATLTLTSYNFGLSSATVLATGSVNYMAIGE